MSPGPCPRCSSRSIDRLRSPPAVQGPAVPALANCARRDVAGDGRLDRTRRDPALGVGRQSDRHQQLPLPRRDPCSRARAVRRSWSKLPIGVPYTTPK